MHGVAGRSHGPAEGSGGGEARLLAKNADIIYDKELAKGGK